MSDTNANYAFVQIPRQALILGNVNGKDYRPFRELENIE